MNFAIPSDHRVKLKESEQKDKYIDLASELKNKCGTGNDDYNNCNLCGIGTESVRFGNKTIRFWNNETSKNHPNYSITENDQNTEKKLAHQGLNLKENEKRDKCSTMGVGCQSRRFNCLFWRETRQRILGHEISPYPEVVRGGEWELTTRPGRQSW